MDADVAKRAFIAATANDLRRSHAELLAAAKAVADFRYIDCPPYVDLPHVSTDFWCVWYDLKAAIIKAEEIAP